MSVTARQVKAGMAWIAGISLLRDGLQFGVMLVLVRLLDAKAYGEFSLVSSVAGLLTVVSFHSFLEHTIQVRPGKAVDYQAHFTFGAFTQTAAVIALNIVAAVLRRFPAYAPVAPLLTVISIGFVLDWAAELRVRMLERELNWSRLRMLEAAGIVGNAATAIVLALRGAGVYALLIPGFVALLPFAYDLFFVMRWRPSWSFHWERFRPAWHYGLMRMTSGIAARGQQVLESGVLAGMVGLAGLGVYGRATGLASFACLKFTSVMTLTLFPMVTRFLPNSEAFQRASGLVLRAVAWTSIPVAGVLSLVAGPVVRTLYGSRWLATIPLLPWALALASLTALMEAAAFLLLANLEPRKTLLIDLVNLGGTGLSLWWLAPFGLVVYMAGLLVTQALLVVASLVWLVQSGAMEARAIGQALAVPAGAAICLGMAARVAAVQSVSGAIALAMGFALVYVLALRVFCAEAFLELVRFLPGRSSKERAQSRL